MNGAMEIRRLAEIGSLKAGKLEGYAAVFNSESQDLGGFTESIAPGAFSRTLKSSDNVMALYDHDTRSLLGRVGNKTLMLNEDTVGLFYEVELPNTTVANDLSVLIERGDVAGASFAFTVPKGGDIWTERNGKPHRELLDVDLFEITVTPNPAYSDTTVAKRHLKAPCFNRQVLALRFLETV